MGKVYSKYVLIGIITFLTLVLIGVSYAYWRGGILGEGANIAVTIDEAHIIFTDDTEIAESDVNPGWSTSKTFTIENQGTADFRYDIYIKNFVNTLETEEYFQYKITSTNGYNMDDYAVLPKNTTASNYDLATRIVVPGGVTQEYTIEFRYVNDPYYDQSIDMGKGFSGKLMVKATDEIKLYDRILADHPTVNTRKDFDSVFGNTTTGVIYKESTYRETPESTGSENNNKDVYYFAGNVKDNWLSFGGYMWRIIRTNEDGGIRLLYHGTSTTATNSYIAYDTLYNETADTTMYVGYMYGTEGSIDNNRTNTTSSNIKTVIDDWYKNNLLNKYDTYVSKTAIYCNDRASEEYKSSGSMNYAAVKRLEKKSSGKSGNQPTYQCGQNPKDSDFVSSPASVADKFSVSTESGGNGQLEYGIALMTADELSFAGALYLNVSPSTYYYLNSSGVSSTGNNWWWSMSPSYTNAGGSTAVYGVNTYSNKGRLETKWAYGSSAVRPVLSLKSCVTWEEGNGIANNPYTVSVNDTCSVAIN